MCPLATFVFLFFTTFLLIWFVFIRKKSESISLIQRLLLVFPFKLLDCLEYFQNTLQLDITVTEEQKKCLTFWDEYQNRINIKSLPMNALPQNVAALKKTAEEKLSCIFRNWTMVTQVSPFCTCGFHTQCACGFFFVLHQI